MADTQQTPKEQPAKSADVKTPEHNVDVMDNSVHETYFFPDLQKSVVAESLEAALAIVNKKEK